MKNNVLVNKFRWRYLAGFFVILAMPILTLPPWFYPPDWGKTIIFRSIMAVLSFLFLWQALYRKNEISSPDIRKNKLIYALAALSIIFLLASIFSVDPYFSFWGSPYRGGGFVTFAFYFIFAILTFILFKKEDWKKAWIFSISIGILVSLIALIQAFGLFSNVFASGGRPSSTIGNPIFLGIYLLLLFFPALSFAIKENNKYLKIFYIFSLLLFSFTTLITGSRAAYFGIVAGIFYFLFFYPKKFKLLKVCLALLFVFIFSAVLYANIHPQLPKILQNNTVKGVVSRLSIGQVFKDERFRAWQTVFQGIKDRPILGWGPENLAVGFDKNYNPNITWSSWWDKAHNVFFDIGAEAGVSGIIAYILLFIALFWQLQKSKETADQEDKKIIFTGLQATLTGYLVANFFSFDSMPTYLLFFFIIGYSLHLTAQNQNQNQNRTTPTKKWWKPALITILSLMLIIFLWQYNLVPFQINTQINTATNLIAQKKCDLALVLMDKELQNHSFLDSFLRMEYVDDIKICDGYYPENDLAYAQKGLLLLKEAVKIQPLYTRYWIYLGSFTTIIAHHEQDPAARDKLIEEAYSYFDKAAELSPQHTEIFTEKATADMVNGDYQKMKQDAQKCMAIKPALSDCYWARAISEVYLKENAESDADIKTAIDDGFLYNSSVAIVDLGHLIDAYDKNGQYEGLAHAYELLIPLDPKNAQYHASSAFAYSKIGEYKKAREQAMIFLELMPSAKNEFDAFLKTLPY